LYSNLYNLYIDDNGEYYNFYYQEALDIYGAVDTKKMPKRFYFKYYDKAYDYLTQEDLEVG
jgi:hypothetical protein